MGIKVLYSSGLVVHTAAILPLGLDVTASVLVCSWRALGLDEAAGAARTDSRGAAEGGGLPRPRHRRRRQRQHLPVPRESSRQPAPVCSAPFFSFFVSCRCVCEVGTVDFCGLYCGWVGFIR